MLKGVALDILWPQATALILLTLAILSASVLTISRRLD